jgi:hypothetical protein
LFATCFAMISMQAYNNVMSLDVVDLIFLFLLPVLAAYYLYLVSYDLAFVCMHYIHRCRHKNTEYQ